MVSRRSFRREFKLGICRQVVEGTLTKSRACREHGLSPGMLDRWVDQYKALGEKAFPYASGGPTDVSESEKVKELETMVGRLTLENEFLKKFIQKGGLARGKRRE